MAIISIFIHQKYSWLVIASFVITNLIYIFKKIVKIQNRGFFVCESEKVDDTLP